MSNPVKDEQQQQQQRQSVQDASSDNREGYANDQSERQQGDQYLADQILNSPKMQEQQARKEQLQQKSKENKTGLPEELKLSMEQKFKVSLDDVVVYYNSNQPAMFGALAYAVGNKIYIGPGQEKHLDQELAHVIQQKLGLAKGSSKDQVNVDPNLETQALNMADQAQQTPVEDKAPVQEQPVMQPQQEVMQLQGDEELIQQLDALSRGESLGDEVNVVALKNQAVDNADAHLSGVTGEDNFAELLIMQLKTDINKAYTQIKQGQNQAIAEVQASMNNAKAQQDMARSMLLAFSSIAVAWLPLASAHVAGLSAGGKMLPKYVTAIQSLGNSKLPGAINNTVKAINSLVKTNPGNAKAAMDNQADLLNQKTIYAIHSSILGMAGTAAASGDAPLDAAARTALKTDLTLQILQTVLPDYKGLIAGDNYAGIAAKAKTDFLKQTIIETGQLNPDDTWMESEDTVEGNPNKTGHEATEHAVNAIGGEEEFANSLDNPHEMAFGTLNVSLRKLGLSIDTTKEVKLQATTTDYLSEHRRFHLNIDDPQVFTEFLKDEHGYVAQKFGAQSGAIKDLQAKYPASSSMFGGGATVYNFSYEDVNISNGIVGVRPAQLESILEGKVVDITSFDLEFDTNGTAQVYELELNRTSRNFGMGTPHERESISGANKGIVSA